MPPITNVDAVIMESSNSSKEVSGNGPFVPVNTQLGKKAHKKELSLSSKRLIVKKIDLNQNATKIPKRSKTEVEAEQTISEESIYFAEQRKLDRDKRAIYIARETFKTRKSYSTMEMQRGRPGSIHSKSIVPASLALKPITPKSDSRMERSFMMSSDYYCFNGEKHEVELNAKLAGMRIFASIMLNAWRRRRDDVRNLKEDMSKLKKNSLKSKSQIHVINSLFKLEQKQNDELNAKLRRMLDDQKKIQEMYTDLNTTYVELKARNCIVEGELVSRLKEQEGWEMVVNDTKSQLFNCMARERELETCLSNEQRKNQELENNKNDLLNQLSQIEIELGDKENEWEDQISIKNEEIKKLHGQLDMLEKRLSDLKIKETQCQEYEKLDLVRRKTIEELQTRITNLEVELNNTLKYKMKAMFSGFPEKGLQLAHLLMFYLLPALPPPAVQSFPTPKFDKALSLIWNN